MESTAVKILRIPALVKKLGIGRSTIYDWMKPGTTRYDPTFPSKVQLGVKTVGWLESEIDEWILSKTKQPPTPVSP
ncbi:AlpA family transcriptional regulator [uncultured Pantoea sp.]|uniref:helix-turn-helix transcriptional regulator n=1 Tax=uncultured Pantoea sp. TaxID=218084 RepID=UPI0025857B06|nr:AlpA family transcriptional regulator [uncultured Pantoea sp.]